MAVRRIRSRTSVQTLNGSDGRGPVSKGLGQLSSADGKMWRWLRSTLGLSVDDSVDDSVLKRLERLGGEELLEQMIELFLENAPRRIDAARTAIASGDRKGIERATHSLKTTAGNLGASRLQDIAGMIEKNAADAELDRVVVMIEELEQAYLPVKARLEKEYRALTK